VCGMMGVQTSALCKGLAFLMALHQVRARRVVIDNTWEVAC
jgi:hypothetical protein